MNNVPIWSPDGQQIVFASARDGLLDLYRRASDASSPNELLLKLNAQPILFPSDWSADGRFLIYYRTDPKTQLDIWTLSLVVDRRSIGISTEGGTRPRWRRDGKELLYLAPDRKLMAVTVKTGAMFEADAPRALFPTELNVTALRQSYAVSADGNSFLLNTSLGTESPPITVVLNWPALLKK